MPMNMQEGGSAYEQGNAGFRARTFINSQRYRDLDRRQSYFDCTQHDYKRFDFEGRVISSGGGISATQPLLSSEKYSSYIPLRSRRPSSPYRLARVIVNSFTNMVFGEGRFPQFLVKGDNDTQDFVQTLAREMRMPVKMIHARNLGGAVGTVGLSYCYLEGKPRLEVHNGKNLYVHEWVDRSQCLPRHVTELYQVPHDEWDGQKQRYVRNPYWYRRDWTPNVDVVFVPVKDEAGQDPVWMPDLQKSEEHNDGQIHFAWIQNRPNDDIDGLPDYEGLYEGFDTIDLLLSVITRGATLNLDPTLKLKMDPDIVNRMGVKKGSDNALITGKDGDAEYLELVGGSIEAGIKLFEAKRRAMLEVAQCVIPNPDEITANGTSSVAMKMLYAPMLGALDILREQYVQGMVQVLDPMVTIARMASRSSVTIYDSEGIEQEAERHVMLPPRVEREPKTDDKGNPTGEEDDINQVERTPGEGGEIEPQWGPYFMPTPTDQQNTVTTLSTAVGGVAIMSTQTATEIVMGVFNRSPGDEIAKVAQEKQQAADQQADQLKQSLGAAGGQVGGKNALPPGAKPKPPGGGKPPGGAGGGAGKPPKAGSGQDTQSEEA